VTQTVLLLRCPDRPGIVAAVGQTVAALGGNIIHADQHTDRVHDLFLQRVEAVLPDGADIEGAPPTTPPPSSTRGRSSTRG
jgi:formyltetrahydrofolate hydrolase